MRTLASGKHWRAIRISSPMWYPSLIDVGRRFLGVVRDGWDRWRRSNVEF
jgi:hypothetical protein